LPDCPGHYFGSYAGGTFSFDGLPGILNMLAWCFNETFARTPLPACGHPLPALRGEGRERGALGGGISVLCRKHFMI
jgi:hypothetical protein